MKLRGSMVAIVTPFRDDVFDEAAFRRLIEMHIRAGTSAIVPCGTTGESATLSHEEHDRVVEVTVQAVRGRVPVIAGTGSNNTREAVRLTQHAKRAGADGALLISPYYNKPTQRGLFLHFKAVAESVNLPLVLYNIASRTAVNIEPETFGQLARLKNIVAVKEASGNLVQISRIIKETNGRITILSGDDPLTLPMLAIGATGVISVVANVIPRQIAGMIEAFESGSIKKAIALHQKMLPLARALFLETNPIPVKTAMHMMGMIERGLRLPLCELSELNHARLETALKEYGLLGRRPAPSALTDRGGQSGQPGGQAKTPTHKARKRRRKPNP